MRTVEIQGVKFEVDLEAQKVYNFKIGDKVKVLKKEYQTHKIYRGVIVAFDDFNNLPTIQVLCITGDYSPELKFININAETEDAEIIPCDEKIPDTDRHEVTERIKYEIRKKEEEIFNLRRKLDFFMEKFESFFEETA